MSTSLSYVCTSNPSGRLHRDHVPTFNRNKSTSPIYDIDARLARIDSSFIPIPPPPPPPLPPSWVPQAFATAPEWRQRGMHGHHEPKDHKMRRLVIDKGYWYKESYKLGCGGIQTNTYSHREMGLKIQLDREKERMDGWIAFHIWLPAPRLTCGKSAGPDRDRPTAIRSPGRRHPPHSPATAAPSELPPLRVNPIALSKWAQNKRGMNAFAHVERVKSYMLYKVPTRGWRRSATQRKC